jgi:hypothetical protein
MAHRAGCCPALAHDRPFDPETWPLIQAGADLAAIAIERHRRP